MAFGFGKGVHEKSHIQPEEAFSMNAFVHLEHYTTGSGARQQENSPFFGLFLAVKPVERLRPDVGGTPPETAGKRKNSRKRGRGYGPQEVAHFSEECYNSKMAYLIGNEETP